MLIFWYCVLIPFEQVFIALEHMTLRKCQNKQTSSTLFSNNDKDKSLEHRLQ